LAIFCPAMRPSLTRSAGFPAEGLLLLTIILFYTYKPSYLTFQINLNSNNEKTQ
jgi:hypothetical protein